MDIDCGHFLPGHLDDAISHGLFVCCVRDCRVFVCQFFVHLCHLRLFALMLHRSSDKHRGGNRAVQSFLGSGVFLLSICSLVGLLLFRSERCSFAVPSGHVRST